MLGLRVVVRKLVKKNFFEDILILQLPGNLKSSRKKNEDIVRLHSEQDVFS